jgi:hypothetical protein
LGEGEISFQLFIHTKTSGERFNILDFTVRSFTLLDVEVDTLREDTYPSGFVGPCH